MCLKTDPKTNFYQPYQNCTLPFIKMEQERWIQEDGVEEVTPDEDLGPVTFCVFLFFFSFLSSKLCLFGRQSI